MSKLIKHMIKTYCAIVKGSIIAYGVFSFSFFKWSVVLPIQTGIIHLTLLLDNVFFPKYKKIKLQEPIFILGHPRSGTTLLHHILTDSENFITFEYWETRFPALITRLFVKPIVDILTKLKMDVVIPKITGHETRLRSIEEEDFLFLLLFDTSFLAVFSPLIFNRELRENGFNLLHDSQSHRHETMKFLKNCFKRQVFYKGNNKILAKMNLSILRIQTLYKTFPDAKVIYLARNPLKAIPSSHSLARKIHEHILIKPNMSEDWYKKWYKDRNIDRSLFEKRLYEMNVLLYKHFYESLEQGKIPKEQILEIDYDELTTDLEDTVKKIISFTGITLSEKTILNIQKQHEKQKEYKRTHKVYTLDELNLSEGKIRTDLAFLFNSKNEQQAIAAEK